MLCRHGCQFPTVLFYLVLLFGDEFVAGLRQTKSSYGLIVFHLSAEDSAALPAVKILVAERQPSFY
jgi:hypothetical protein